MSELTAEQQAAQVMTFLEEECQTGQMFLSGTAEQFIAATIAAAAQAARDSALAEAERVCREWSTGYDKSAYAAAHDAQLELDKLRKAALNERDAVERGRADVCTWLANTIAALATPGQAAENGEPK